MFETVSRRVTAYSVLDVIEGTLELNAGAPRVTDWLQSDYDWLVLHDVRVTPRASDEAVELRGCGSTSRASNAWSTRATR